MLGSIDIIGIHTSDYANDQGSVGLLYLWSADSIRKGTANGLEGALGGSSEFHLLLH